MIIVPDFTILTLPERSTEFTGIIYELKLKGKKKYIPDNIIISVVCSFDN